MKPKTSPKIIQRLLLDIFKSTLKNVQNCLEKNIHSVNLKIIYGIKKKI